MKRLLVLLGLTILAGAAPAEIYKWVDAQGKVHYSDSPPPGDAANPVELPPQPSEESLERGREEIARRLQYQRDDSAARREQKANQQQERQEQERAAAERQVRCAFAKNQLQVLQMQAPVFTENEAGEREYADDAYRASEQARFTQEIAQFCD